MAEYSVLAEFCGGTSPVPPHIGLDVWRPSPRSVNAMMFRVLLVVPVLLVTHTSTRVMLMPVITFGSDDMAWS